MKALLLLLLATPCLAAPLWVEKGAALPAGLIQKEIAMTGSMRPKIYGGEMMWVESYHGQPIALGDLVGCTTYGGKRVLHEVVAQNERAILTSGLACRQSDGWSPKRHTYFHTGQPGIQYIVRFIERRPVSHLAQVRP